MVSKLTAWMALKMFLGTWLFSSANVAMSCFTACRLEVPMPSRLWDIFSVIRQAHWMNSRSLYRFQAMMSFSFTQYRGRISSIPGKLVLWSLGIIPWICPP